MEVVEPVLETTMIGIDILEMISTLDADSCRAINSLMSDSNLLRKVKVVV
ncbi:hypothetical protein SAMN05421755_10768 [Nitrosomonas sp. Nm33]|nr:hypothetical protein SAMN05421755_10768 [Nitrosomonas sp. Nm33]